MMIAVITIIVVIVGVLWHLLPARSRSGLSCGVTVPPDFNRTSEGKRILRRYRQMVWIGTGAAVGFLLGASAAAVPLLIIIACIIVFQFIAYHLITGKSNRGTAPHRVATGVIGDADLGPRPALIPSGTIAAVEPLLVFAGLLAFNYVSFDSLPERFPIQLGTHRSRTVD
jgi:uncharacterized membrane protein